jgi:1-acyl-sn-glycerol-3-phosphate acyltransferase
VIFLRSALFNVWFFGISALITIPGTLIALVAPNRMLALAGVWARLVLFGLSRICGIKVMLIGAENLTAAGPILIASAHQSAFDTLVWLTLVPRACYVLKKELTRIPLFGWLIPRTRMIVVDRSAGAAAIRHLLREADRAVRETRQIVIFPEGTRAPLGVRLPLQPGIAALAARTKLPVIPVATDSGRIWSRRAFRKYPGTIRIVVHRPLPIGLSREALMAALETQIHDMGNPATAVDNSVG